MISRTCLPSSQACLIFTRRLGPIPSTVSSSPERCSITERMSAPNLATIRFAKTGPIPLTIPLPKYLSIPSAVVGGTVRRTVAFSCNPCSLSRIHAPSAVSHSPAQTDGEEPTTVTRSRWPVAFTRRTQKPESSNYEVGRYVQIGPCSCPLLFYGY